jgi:hypothetical protein
MRALRRHIDGERFRDRVGRRDHAAAFHEKRAAAMLEDLFAEHMRGLGEGGVGVADADRDEGGEIVRRAAMRQRRAGGQRRRAVGNRRQRREIDLDQRGGILREITALGDHDRDRLADEAGFLLGEAMRHVDLLDRRARHQQRHGLALHRLRQVGIGEHRVHAGQRERGALVDTADRGVRMRAAQHHGMQHPGELDVVDIAPAAGEEIRVLLALDACAEPFCAHQPDPLGAAVA